MTSLAVHSETVYSLTCAFRLFCISLNAGAVARGNAAYGQGTGPKWISDVSCNGKEDKIINCVGMNGNTNGDSHSEDAGVICNTKGNKHSCTKVCVALLK